MINILNLFLQSGNATVSIPLWHIWAFILVVSGMIVVKSVRAIAIVSLFGAVAIGWHSSLAVFDQSMAVMPGVGVCFLLFGIVILGSVACTFDLDN